MLRRRISRRTWLGLALSVAVALALAEVALRFVLFAPAADGTVLARRLRRAGLFAHPQREDLHWELRDRFASRTSAIRVPEHDPDVGWTSGAFAPRTYEHADADPAPGVRPILLFGDSYAQGTTAAADRFEALLARSGLGREHRLLNYGVGGYGLDQVLLLMQRALDLYDGRDPLVIVGVLVDDDLDRCVLSFREWPKPRFELEAGALALRNVPVPRYEEHLARGFEAPPSYLWRLITRGTRPFPGRVRDWLDGARALDREKQALARAILARMQRELDRRELERMFVLFYDLPSVLAPRPSAWRDATLREALGRAGAPVVDVREFMLATAVRTGEDVASYYGGSAELAGHYNARGNQVAFEAMRAGLARHFGIQAEDGPPRDD
jgi:hypothetical protein